MKVYTIIGGVNGTGKSSLTGVLRAQRNDGRQRNLLLLPARKRRDAPVAQVADADGLESPGDA